MTTSSDWKRLHWSSFFFGLGPVARTALPLLLLLILARDLGWQKWLLVPLVPSAIAAIVRLLTQSYRLEENALVLRHGFLFTRLREIPYERIQHVELTQGPLQRALSVAVVVIQSGGNAEEAEASLRVLAAGEAEDLRRRIDAKRTHGSDAEASSQLLRLTGRDMVFAGLAEGRGFLVVGGAIGLIWQGADLLGVPVPFGGIEINEAEVRRGVRFATAWFPSIGRIVLGVALAIVLFRLLSIAWAAVKLHGFTLERDGEILRARYGLITRYAAAIPRHRVQSLTVIETPFLRLARRAAIKVQTAARFQSEQGRVGSEWVAPVIERRRVAALVEDVLPGFRIEALSWQPVDPAAWKREFRGSLLVTAIVIAVLAVPLGFWSVGALVPCVVYGWFSSRGLARRYAYAVTDDAIAYRSGWINHRMSVVRMARVQSVRLDESFRDRRWRMATVGVDTAGAGAASHRVVVPYLPRAVADGLFERVRGKVEKGPDPFHLP